MDDLRLGECWERDGFVILPGHLSPGDLAPPERAQYLPDGEPHRGLAPSWPRRDGGGVIVRTLTADEGS